VSMAEPEGAGFFIGVFSVIGGLVFILLMAVYSVFVPYKVQICVEIEEFPNGVMDYGPNYNKTIPEGTVVQFSCNQGFQLQGPDMKTCHKENGWLPEDIVKCVKEEE